MADEFSFDIVGKVNMQEVLNAVNQASKEISQRFDFKGSKSRIDLNSDKHEITVVADDDYKLRSVRDILEAKLIKRGVPTKSMSYGKPEQASGDTLRVVASIQQGITTERCKEIVKLIKGMGVKVQAEIQSDQVRVKGKKKDELQAVMKAVKDKEYDFHIDFVNYR
jgi:uncharacterized protein YajQ (UPF0234 family)